MRHVRLLIWTRPTISPETSAGQASFLRLVCEQAATATAGEKDTSFIRQVYLLIFLGDNPIFWTSSGHLLDKVSMFSFAIAVFCLLYEKKAASDCQRLPFFLV
jgi:hypothetical protein